MYVCMYVRLVTAPAHSVAPELQFVILHICGKKWSIGELWP